MPLWLKSVTINYGQNGFERSTFSAWALPLILRIVWRSKLVLLSQSCFWHALSPIEYDFRNHVLTKKQKKSPPHSLETCFYHICCPKHRQWLVSNHRNDDRIKALFRWKWLVSGVTQTTVEKLFFWLVRKQTIPGVFSLTPLVISSTRYFMSFTFIEMSIIYKTNRFPPAEAHA